MTNVKFTLGGPGNTFRRFYLNGELEIGSTVATIRNDGRITHIQIDDKFVPDRNFVGFVRKNGQLLRNVSSMVRDECAMACTSPVDVINWTFKYLKQSEMTNNGITVCFQLVITDKQG